MRRALLLGAVLALAGCSESPAAGFEDFYAALVAGVERVLDRLSAASRAHVAAAAKAQGLAPAVALARGGVRSTLRTIRERERSESRAVLEVEDTLGKTEVVTLVLEEGRWRLDLAAMMPPEGPAP